MKPKIYSKPYKLKDLNKEIKSHIFSIPKLQRDFVWDGKKAAALFDSIYKQYPIGNILIWRTKKILALNHQSNILPPYDDQNNSHVNFIIDGQQRMSVIYRTLLGDAITPSKSKEINFSNVVFSLSNNSDESVKYLKRYDKSEYASVAIILSSSWYSSFQNYPQNKLKRIKDFREKVLNYPIQLTYIEGYVKDQVKDAFIRINSLGTSLSKSDRAFSLASSFNIKHYIKELESTINQKFSSLPSEIYLRTLVLINDYKRFSQKEIDKFSSLIDKNAELQQKFKKEWPDLRHSFGLAIDYLRDNFKVLSIELLPSENIIPILTSFFYYNNKKQPNTFQKKQIAKWFWYTSFGKRYSGQGYSTNIISDFEKLKKIALNKTKPAYYIEEKLSDSILRYSDYSVNSSTNSAFYCMLLMRKPRHLINFEPILQSEFSTILNRKNKHHFFPKQHLVDNGFSKNSYNSLLNIIYIPQYENIKIGKKPPRIYLNEFKNKKRFKFFAESHLIPYLADSGLWETNTKKGYKIFQAKRLTMIKKEIERLAGAKLFE